MYEGRKVLVTGGTGMIGVQLVELLIERGAVVRIVSLDNSSRAPRGVEFLRANLMEWESCREAAAGMDFIFHLAGIKGSVSIGASRAASFFVPHLLMNTLMMEAARQAGVERYLYTSSIAVYPPAEVFVEEMAWSGPPHHQDRYAAWAKRMGELQAEAYWEEFGWETIAIVRPANVYGPFDSFDPATAMVVPSLIRRIVDGEDPLVVWGDGTAVRDFIFSRDVSHGMLLALEKAANCRPVNLGSGTGVSIKELVETILDLVPNPPRLIWDESKPSGERRRVMDTSRTEKVLGFRPRTSLGEGLRETVEWYLENRHRGEERYSVFREPSFL